MTKGIMWRCNTPGLLEEILNNDSTWVLKSPLKIFRGILTEVAARAIELDDKELNKLMLRLSLYEISNPSSSEYDSKKVQDYFES